MHRMPDEEWFVCTTPAFVVEHQLGVSASASTYMQKYRGRCLCHIKWLKDLVYKVRGTRGLERETVDEQRPTTRNEPEQEGAHDNDEMEEVIDD